MLTIFSIPKPFHNEISIIQKNAIRSWAHLNPACEVILFGDEEGIEEAAKESDVKHIRDIRRNEYGTPILSDIFEKVQIISQNDYICYVNADIILTSDVMNALSKITHLPEFLLVGKRMNTNIREPITITGNWEADFLKYVERDGTRGRPDQIDCFIFPKGQIKEMPPFAVGRAGWDNWLIASTKKRKIPIIDGTDMFHVIHQNHGYSHVKNQRSDSWEGPETDKNRELMGGSRNLYNIDDADWILTPDGVQKKKTGLRDIYRSAWRSLKK